MMKNRTLFFSAVLTLLLSFNSCRREHAPESVIRCDTLKSTTYVTFSNNIKPIIDSSCAIESCHDGFSQSGAPDFTDFSLIKTEAVGGAMKHQVLDARLMPPSNTMGKKVLDPCELKLFQVWLLEGAPQ